MERCDIVLGFDPGGQGNFGYAVCKSFKDQLQVVHTGVVDDVCSAMNVVYNNIPDDGHVVAAWIDTPLFWGRFGKRKVDEIVRDAVRKCGCEQSGGTVQHVNSLRGAGLVPGILLAKLLQDRLPEVRISEAHPKALLWLLKETTKDVTLGDLGKLLHDIKPHDMATRTTTSEHERDAVLAAYTAWKAGFSEWRDLFEDEPDAVQPLGTAVSYWMPSQPFC